MPPSPLFSRFLQLKNEHFTRRPAQIRLWRQHIPASFSELDQLFVANDVILGQQVGRATDVIANIKFKSDNRGTKQQRID
jgi:hypothetical protein